MEDLQASFGWFIYVYFMEKPSINGWLETSISGLTAMYPGMSWVTKYGMKIHKCMSMLNRTYRKTVCKWPISIAASGFFRW